MSEYIIQAAEWAIDKNRNSLYQGCEEIVRCCDCKHYSKPSNETAPDKICWKHSCFYYPMQIFKPASDGFCAWGERKKRR